MRQALDLVFGDDAVVAEDAERGRHGSGDGAGVREGLQLLAREETSRLTRAALSRQHGSLPEPRLEWQPELFGAPSPR